MKPMYLLIMLSLIYTNAQAGQMYQWVDAEGNVQYTQTPPPTGTQAATKELTTPPPAVTAPPDAKNKDAKDKPAATPEKTDKPDANATPKEKELALKKQNCEQARADLQLLTSKTPLSVTDKNSPDKTMPLDNEARQQRIAERQAFVDVNCGN